MPVDEFGQRGGRGKAGHLTRDGIVAQAVAIADKEGIGAVTIRRLAKDLGVTPMSLYRHVRNKEDLLDAMTEEVLGQIPLVQGEAQEFVASLRGLLHALRLVLLRHPAGIQLLRRRFIPSRNALRALEAVLDILRRAGFDPDQSYLVFEQIVQQTVTLVATEAAVMAESRVAREEEVGRWRALLASLPPGRYPRIGEAAASIAACVEPERHFRFGTEILLAGIAAMAPRADA